jgi:hypothetical protein
MGGPGSGNHYHWWRSSKKDLVEDCRQLDANRWMREGILREGARLSGRWCWFRDASRTVETSSLCYEVDTLDEEGWVRLSYTVNRTGEALDYRIGLTTTAPRFGGRRWWFVCPLVVNGVPCGRRVGKLYLPPGGRYYGCRHCYRLTYTSCRESHKFDALDRRMAAELGWDPADVRRIGGRIGKRRE